MDLMGQEDPLTNADVLQSTPSEGRQSLCKLPQNANSSESFFFHDSAEEIKLKAMLNLSNTYWKILSSCFCYTLAEPS